MKNATEAALQTPIHIGAQSAWIGAMSVVEHSGEHVPGVQESTSVGSGFGTGPRATREVLGASFCITNPRRRLISNDVHTPSLYQAVAFCVWALSGNDDVEAISFYNSRGRCFSDNGRSIPSAPGRRIFQSESGDQFYAAIDRLKRDPTSRRAMIQIFLPVDSITRSRDCSCLGSIQLLIRQGRLNCLTTMRSQSAALVLPYDLFFLTMLHEAASVVLGVELGDYYHHANSLHFYDDEAALVSRILRSPRAEAKAMSPMLSWSEPVRKRLADAELDVRERLNHDPSVLIPVQAYGLDDYWMALLRILILGARRHAGIAPTSQELSEVPPEMASCLA